MLRKPFQWVLKSFFKGLLLVVPVTVTGWTLYFVFRKIDGLLHLGIPGLGFAVTLIFIAAVGVLGSNILVGRLFAFFERLLNRLPLVKLVYFSLKDLLNAFVGEKKSFRTPVLVTLIPESGTKALGFVTAETDLPGGADHVAVYLPQSYNFAGNLVLVPRERISPLPSEESAKWLAFIVSGGVSRGPGGAVIGGEDFGTGKFPRPARPPASDSGQAQ